MTDPTPLASPTDEEILACLREAALIPHPFIWRYSSVLSPSVVTRLIERAQEAEKRVAELETRLAPKVNDDEICPDCGQHWTRPIGPFCAWAGHISPKKRRGIE